MPVTRPCVLSIAGFDPSAGAGILADIKTLESLGVYGIGACSAITCQNDVSFQGVEWIPAEDIIRQVEALDKRFKYQVAKIGLIQDFNTLKEIIDYLLSVNPAIRIILDPVLKASAGFEFHSQHDLDSLHSLLNEIYLFTPNFEEAQRLGPGKDAVSNARSAATQCHVLLKGGHKPGGMATDVLFSEGREYSLEYLRLPEAGKHGSGCVLSSAIAAGIAGGLTLFEACARAKEYITLFLKSEKGLIGYHPVLSK